MRVQATTEHPNPLKLIIVNASIVLAGQMYNPTLFSYEGVKQAKIAKRKWELLQPPITTPVVSVLRFNNRLNLLIEPNRVQILVDKPARRLDQTALTEVANSVVRRLSSNRHTAVGFNITAIIELENATEYLRMKFLKDDSLNIGELKDLALVYSYERPEVVLNLNYSSGTASFEGEDRIYVGVLVVANYHAEFPANFTVDAASREAKRQIALAAQHYEDFLTLIPQVFELQEENNETS